MEIERKWMLKGWPPEELGLPLLYEQSMRQGYISVRPTVRIRELEDLIGLPLIPKVRRTYGLPDGLKLEVNHVDEGLPTEFWYAEIEYPTAEIARGWNAESISPVLAEYLNDDVTEEPGQTMGAYWIITRLHQQ